LQRLRMSQNENVKKSTQITPRSEPTVTKRREIRTEIWIESLKLGLPVPFIHSCAKLIRFFEKLLKARISKRDASLARKICLRLIIAKQS
jgi:hypothetical protein